MLTRYLVLGYINPVSLYPIGTVSVDILLSWMLIGNRKTVFVADRHAIG